MIPTLVSPRKVGVSFGANALTSVAVKLDTTGLTILASNNVHVIVSTNEIQTRMVFIQPRRFQLAKRTKFGIKNCANASAQLDCKNATESAWIAVSIEQFLIILEVGRQPQTESRGEGCCVD